MTSYQLPAELLNRKERVARFFSHCLAGTCIGYRFDEVHNRWILKMRNHSIVYFQLRDFDVLVETDDHREVNLEHFAELIQLELKDPYPKRATVFDICPKPENISHPRFFSGEDLEKTTEEDNTMLTEMSRLAQSQHVEYRMRALDMAYDACKSDLDLFIDNRVDATVLAVGKVLQQTNCVTEGEVFDRAIATMGLIIQDVWLNNEGLKEVMAVEEVKALFVPVLMNALDVWATTDEPMKCFFMLLQVLEVLDEFEVDASLLPSSFADMDHKDRDVKAYVDKWMKTKRVKCT